MQSVGRVRLACMLALVLALPVTAIAPADAAPTRPPSATSAARVLAKYRALMSAFPKPANMVFTYSETRTGPSRIVSDVHRVYRDSAGNQRNDTIELNGSRLRPPQTQTYVHATWPYHADAFAARPADYDATFTGATLVNGRHAYVFTLKRHDSAAFAITQVTLDAATALPLRELFAVSSNSCTGDGTIEFSASGSFWLPSMVDVGCTMGGAGGAQYKDTIHFADYSFPEAIPNDVLHPTGVTTP